MPNKQTTRKVTRRRKMSDDDIAHLQETFARAAQVAHEYHEQLEQFPRPRKARARAVRTRLPRAA